MALKIPSQIAGKKEIIKLIRELDSLSEAVLQHNIVKKETGGLKPLPRPSATLQSIFRANDIIMKGSNLDDMKKQLEQIKDSAKSVRVAFSAEPDNDSLTKIVDWFRREVDPQILVNVGIQPTIAGGIVLQTPVHRYDFSLRKRVLNSQDSFRKALENVS